MTDTSVRAAFPIPSISVLTPSLEQLPFLKVCVASIVAQGYPKVEQVVADGGSSDGTASYLATSPGLVSRWRCETDRGQSDALNWALSQASGDWIGWQNADDFYLPGALWRAARAIAAHPSALVVVGDVIVVDENGVALYSVGVDPVPATRWLEGFWPYNQGVFFHRSVLAKAGPLDVALHLHMDTDLLARVAQSSPPVVYIDAPLGAFRKHAGGKTILGADASASLRERRLLAERYGRPLWPQGAAARFLHRLRAHVFRLRRFGPAATLRRIGDRASRANVVRLVR